MIHPACERAQREKVRVCAYGEVFSVHTPSRSWQLPLSGRNTARKHKKSEQCARLQNGGCIQENLTMATKTFVAMTFRANLLVLVEFENRGVVVVIADPTVLCLATLESASLAIDGPKMKNSASLGFLSMLRMKMMRNTSAS